MVWMDVNPYESPKHVGYDPPKIAIHRPKWSLAQHIEGWLTTGFAAAVVLPMVVFLQHLVAEPGTTRAIWWWVTIPSIGMVAVVVYLAARTARIV
jgi:hypothetical protein